MDAEYRITEMLTVDLKSKPTHHLKYGNMVMKVEKAQNFVNEKALYNFPTHLSYKNGTTKELSKVSKL